MTQQKVHDQNTSSNTRKRLKTKVEVNKTKDTTHRRVTKTRDLSVHEEPVSPGIVSHPFSFVILTSLDPHARLFSQNPFLTFSLIAHLFILQSLIFFFNPSPGRLMDK